MSVIRQNQITLYLTKRILPQQPHQLKFLFSELGRSCEERSDDCVQAKEMIKDGRYRMIQVDCNLNEVEEGENCINLTNTRNILAYGFITSPKILLCEERWIASCWIPVKFSLGCSFGHDSISDRWG
jgi:hypothetical protein